MKLVVIREKDKHALAAFMAQHDMSVDKASRALGLSRFTIDKVLKQVGHYIKPKTLDKLHKALAGHVDTRPKSPSKTYEIKLDNPFYSYLDVKAFKANLKPEYVLKLFVEKNLKKEMGRGRL